MRPLELANDVLKLLSFSSIRVPLEFFKFALCIFISDLIQKKIAWGHTKNIIGSWVENPYRTSASIPMQFITMRRVLIEKMGMEATRTVHYTVKFLQ